LNFLLDTNAVAAVLDGEPAVARAQLKKARRSKSSIAISTIVLHELWLGVARSRYQIDNAKRLRKFLDSGADVISFDEADAIRAGELRADLLSRGLPIGPYDVLIAAQAIRLGYTLVTANASEFSRVAGLKWIDWTSE
jgi:tRNA(fMet)-specific endonuclease VapC